MHICKGKVDAVSPIETLKAFSEIAVPSENSSPLIMAELVIRWAENYVDVISLYPFGAR